MERLDPSLGRWCGVTRAEGTPSVTLVTGGNSQKMPLASAGGVFCSRGNMETLKLMAFVVVLMAASFVTIVALAAS